MPSVPLPDSLRILLLLIAVAAGVTDILWRKIPNWLALAGLIAGFAAHYYLEGTAGLLVAAKGFSLAFLIYFPLWLLRAMGAGDVKLMAALGAIAGPGHWFLVFLAAGILGAVAALFLASRYGRSSNTLLTTVHLAKELVMLRAPWRELPQVDYRHKDSLRLPYGAIIAAGIIVLAALRLT